MDFKALLDEFTAAVAAGDGSRFAACFTDDGVYDDVFYGEFEGRAAIAEMLEGLFHRDGKDFRWDMVNPVADAGHGYAKWYFSYTGLAPDIAGKRILMEGAGIFELRDGLIARYADLVKSAELLKQLNLAPGKRDRLVEKMTARQLADPAFKGHEAS